MLIANSAVTVPIVRNLTNNIRSQEVVAECITIFESLVNANPDLKKKVVGLQFMEGLISSASKLEDEERQLNRILLALIRCFSRLDGDLFEPALRLTKSLLKVKKLGGNKEISEALRTEMKGNNKFAHLCIAEVAGSLYTSDDIGSDKNVADLIK